MPKHKMINWKVTDEDARLIDKIVERAMVIVKEQRLSIEYKTLQMDITACHANGNPLRLQELLDCQDGSFGHDVFGINRFISRTTGKIPANLFHPRFSAPVTKEDSDG